MAVQSLVPAEAVASASMEAKCVGRGVPRTPRVKGPLGWALNADQLLLELDLLPEGTAGAPKERKFCVITRPLGPPQLLLLLHVATVVLPAHDLELDTRQVLRAAALYEDHVVLLQAVALSRDEADSLPASAEPHAATLAVGRVGLLGLADKGAQDHALQLWPALRRAWFRRRKLRGAPTV